MKLASLLETLRIDPRAYLVSMALASAPAHANCLSMDRDSARTGGISTESATLVNACGYAVDYHHCNTGGGSFACERAAGGGVHGTVAAYGRAGFSVMGARMPFGVYFAECRHGLELEDIRWTGSALRWNCRDREAEQRQQDAERERRQQAEQSRRQAEQDAREERARLEAQQARQRREWEALEQRQRDHAERARRQYEELRRAEEEKQRRLREQQARAYQQGQNFLNTLARIQEAEDARREAEEEREEAERAQRRAREAARQEEAREAQRRQEEERRRQEAEERQRMLKVQRRQEEDRLRQEELARQKDALARQGLDNPFESGVRPSQAKAVANPFDTPVPGSAPMKLAQANPFDDPPSGGNPFAAPASAESGCARDIRLWQENHSTRRFDAACEEHRHAERKYAAGAELYRRCPSHDAGGRLAAEYARKWAEARAALTAGCPAEP